MSTPHSVRFPLDLERLVQRYADEGCGNFNTAVRLILSRHAHSIRNELEAVGAARRRVLGGSVSVPDGCKILPFRLPR